MNTCKHKDRPHRARGLCASCYEVQRRSEKFLDNPRPYSATMVEELEFMPDFWTWAELERAFRRPRKVLEMRLRYRDRHDLIRRLDEIEQVRYGDDY